jgi:hypothetical protein
VGYCGLTPDEMRPFLRTKPSLIPPSGPQTARAGTGSLSVSCSIRTWTIF